MDTSAGAAGPAQDLPRDYGPDGAAGGLSRSTPRLADDTTTLLRRTRHQEHWQAVGTHYGPTRIYGPTGHAIGGATQLALLELIYRCYHRLAARYVSSH